MSYRTNPDRILENIDRQRSREEHAPRARTDRQATGRELDTEPLDSEATVTERLRRIFKLVERGYTATAQTAELAPLAARFRAIGDIPNHHARGDVSVSIQYLDSRRPDDIGMVPFEIHPDDLVEMRQETETSRPDVNAMRLIRKHLRDGVMAGYKKVEPRIRDAIRERADMGHVAVQVTIDVRPAL
jgi:hypothetical protein